MKTTERSLTKSFRNSDGSVTIEFNNGTKETIHPLNTKAFESASTTTSKAGATTTTTTTTSSYSKSWNSYGNGHTQSYDIAPTKAFTAYGIEFWGCSKYKLNDVVFDYGDLIINFTGTIWTPNKPPEPKLFVKESPKWMKLPEIKLYSTPKHNQGERAEQLLIDWPDMKTPPDEADFDFWSSILQQAMNNDIKRIFCCCMAGKGRTGTGLASLLLATGAVDEPDVAIDYIRENYSKSAIETLDQEKYIFNLIYQPINSD